MCHFIFLIEKFFIAAVELLACSVRNNLHLLLNNSLHEIIFDTKSILIKIKIRTTDLDQHQIIAAAGHAVIVIVMSVCVMDTNTA